MNINRYLFTSFALLVALIACCDLVGCRRRTITPVGTASAPAPAPNVIDRPGFYLLPNDAGTLEITVVNALVNYELVRNGVVIASDNDDEASDYMRWYFVWGNDCLWISDEAGNLVWRANEDGSMTQHLLERDRPLPEDVPKAYTDALSNADKRRWGIE